MAKQKYEVGYKKPPKKTQFKKGKSGNPKGRPKGSNNMVTLIIEALDKNIIVQQNGKPYTMTQREAMVARLMHNALTGDMRSLMTILGVEADRKEADPDDFEITDNDKATMQRMINKLLKSKKVKSNHAK